MKLPQPFNNPSTYNGHSGVDYGQPEGKLIKASGNGTVQWIGYANDRAGYATIVSYNGVEVMYCHQPKNAHRPSPGSKVIEGSALGSVGSSGRSTGPHLHMEILNGAGAHTYDGVWNYFDKNSVVGEGSTSGSATYEEEIVPYIANVKGSFYLIQSVNGRPTGHLLGKASKARESGIPILDYADDWSVDQLKKTTTLL